MILFLAISAILMKQFSSYQVNKIIGVTRKEFSIFSSVVSEGLITQQVSHALERKFSSRPSQVSRVLECWKKFSKGEIIDRNILLPSSDWIRQSANCYVDGLPTQPFYSIKDFPWATKLQEHHQEIFDELRAYNSEQSSWLSPRDIKGSAYGPEWKTLGLQDRNNWDEEKVKYFPKTVGYSQKYKIPSCEVFFAKQGPHSSIQPHSDQNNFILSYHLGLDIPPGRQCFLQVGNERHYWSPGQSTIFDGSIYHSTENNSDQDRIILLIRFYHPNLTSIEIQAFQFLFEYLDYLQYGTDDQIQQFEDLHFPIITKKQNKRRGFGK